jgi:hypothetical protein
MNDAQLRSMTSKELRQLRDDIDAAIRAAIAKSRPKAPSAAVQEEAPKTFDLEKERDAWKARKAAGPKD